MELSGEALIFVATTRLQHGRIFVLILPHDLRYSKNMISTAHLSRYSQNGRHFHVTILDFTKALRLTSVGASIVFRKKAARSKVQQSPIQMTQCRDGVWRHAKKLYPFQSGGVFSQYVDNAEYIVRK